MAKRHRWRWLPNMALVVDAGKRPVVLLAGRDGQLLTRGEDGQLVALTQDHLVARRIEAVPELEEALIFCRSVIESQGMFDLSERMAFDKATAALAAARGADDHAAQ